MKKYRYIFILIAAAVFAGCTVTKDKEYGPVDESGYTLVQADVESLLFGDDQRVWPEGAAIGVYGSEMGDNEPFVIKYAGEGLKTAGFYGPMVKGTLLAYFPYSESYVGDASAMPYSIESEQVYVSDPVEMFENYTPMAFAGMTDGKLKFSYPNGLLKVTVESRSAVTVKQVRITSAESKLSGLGVFHADSRVSMTESSQNYVELDCGDGVSATAADGTLNGFYLVLAPGTYDDLQLSVTLEGADAPFACAIPEVEIKKISATDFSMVTVGFRPKDELAGFEEVEVKFHE